MLDYIILGMLFNCCLTGYDLKKHIENGVGVFYRASYGSIYPTLTHLSSQGLVSAMQQSRGARVKKVYEITPDGKLAFLEWLKRPLDINENGNHSHLVKVYFFDSLSSEIVQKQLLEYEISNTRYLNRLLTLARSFDSAENQRDHYYKLATLYYGIGILNETLRWCRFIREKRPFQDFIKGEITNEQTEG